MKPNTKVDRQAALRRIENELEATDLDLARYHLDPTLVSVRKVQALLNTTCLDGSYFDLARQLLQTELDARWSDVEPLLEQARQSLADEEAEREARKRAAAEEQRRKEQERIEARIQHLEAERAAAAERRRVEVAEHTHGVADLDDEIVDDDYDWVVPNLLETGDRCVVTGTPGVGKMTLLRQFAIQIASGIHPVTLESLEPQRVLLVDVQESTNQARRELKWPKRIAGDRLTEDCFRMMLSQDFADIADPLEFLLDSVLVELDPKVIVIGPIRRVPRLFGLDGDMTQSDPAVEELQAKLDLLRGEAERVILIEAHPGHSARPGVIGPSRWRDWPEFGYQLSATGLFFPWRGDREERIWPRRWRRNDGKTQRGSWLFTAVSETNDATLDDSDETEPDYDERWATLLDTVATTRHTSQRKLSELTGFSKSTIQRMCQRHADEWAAVLREAGVEEGP